jgi:hypothetical protein
VTSVKQEANVELAVSVQMIYLIRLKAMQKAKTAIAVHARNAQQSTHAQIAQPMILANALAAAILMQPELATILERLNQGWTVISALHRIHGASMIPPALAIVIYAVEDYLVADR